MQHDYDILITANIELGGKFTADSLEEALIVAKNELRSAGELTNITVERAVMLDEEG